MQEPIRIITKSHTMSIAAAAMLLGALHEEDMKCSVHVVPNYTAYELGGLKHEEYPTFIFLDCVEATYRAAFSQATFLSSPSAYDAIRDLPSAKKFAHILVAGIVAQQRENGVGVNVPDDLLQTALQSEQLIAPKHHRISDVNEDLLGQLRFAHGGVLKNLFDVADMVTACARMRKAPEAIAALLHDTQANVKVSRLLGEYNREVENALKWCKEHEEHTHRFTGVLEVHVRDYVASYLTGSIAQHLVNEAADKNTLIMVLACAPDDMIRFSLRSAGMNEKIDLLSLLGRILDGVECDFGGTKEAAGGVFNRKDEQKFLSTARKVLQQAFIEERV